MHFLAALLVATATLTLAFVMPRNQASGIYTAQLDDEGNIVGNIVMLSNITSSAEAPDEVPHGPPPPKLLAARGFIESMRAPRDIFPGRVDLHCGNDFFYDKAEWATFFFIRGACWGGHKLVDRSAMWMTDWDIAWYVCTKKGSQGCSDREAWDARARLNYGCGGTKTGEIYIVDWAKTFGRARPGQKGLCTGAT